MNEPRIGFEPDLLARLELMAFAENRDDVLAAEFCDDLGLRAGGFDDLHFGFGAVVGKRKMFRPHAIYCRTAIVAGTRRWKGKFEPGRSFEAGGAVDANSALDHVHRRR